MRRLRRALATIFFLGLVAIARDAQAAPADVNAAQLAVPPALNPSARDVDSGSHGSSGGNSLSSSLH